MATELARQGCLGLFYLGFNVGMSGLPHDGVAAGLGDDAFEVSTAFYVKDYRGLRVARDDILGKQHHHFIRPDDFALWRYDT